MSLTGLGTRQRGVRLPILSLLSGGMLLASLIMFTLELANFSQNRDKLQTDITVGGVPVTGLTLSEAAATWQNVYEQPLTLTYQGNPILLYPAEIGFRVNSAQMQEEIRAKLITSSNYWADFWNYLWQQPTAPVEVALSADYSEARLREFLTDVAYRYDQGASDAGFDLSTMSFRAGAGGLKLDLKASMAAIQEALFRPTNREVALVMENEGGRAADMKTLEQAVRAYLNQIAFDPDGPETLASVGVIDLQTGDEMWIHPDIAYSAMSTIKIPILINIFSKLSFAPDDQVKWLMGASILCSNNSASNFLMQIPGQGANERLRLGDGLRQVTETAKSIGANYTFITAPLWVGAEPWSISNDPPPVPNPLYNAKPDLWSRTTPEDMAVMLQMLYDCAEFGSGLAAAMPENFTQLECKQMVELLSGNIINRLIELGAPLGTRIAHKNGWGGSFQIGANVSDAAIVYSPGGNYILVTYMWEAKADQSGIGSLLPWEGIEGISRIVYNFFNPTQPLITARIPDNAFGAVDCVMPDPTRMELLDLNNIRSGRFDENGHILPDACYGYPACGQDPIPPSFKP
ncbi:hypothetical protein ANAEL_05108 [Anaerolineales bacterium]|nr:hypothetical protein ANAEL_05108 [Anaerolineales bacterium]